MMKIILIILSFILLNIGAFAQDLPSSYEEYLYDKYFNTLSNKTVMLEVSTPSSKLENFGSGFIVNKKGKLYLITNYHIIPSYDQNDTTLLSHIDKRPSFVNIRFHSKTPSKHGIVKTYQLYDSKGKRLFFTVANSSNKDIDPKSITDISILPLGLLDKSILIDTIKIWDNINPFASKGDIVSIWGFRHGHIILGHYPIIDTGIVLANSLNINGRHPIVIRTHKPMAGDSGAPVYLIKNNTFYFIGIDSSEGGLGTTLPDYDDLSKTQNLIFVIPKKTIREALMDLIK